MGAWRVVSVPFEQNNLDRALQQSLSPERDREKLDAAEALLC